MAYFAGAPSAEACLTQKHHFMSRTLFRVSVGRAVTEPVVIRIRIFMEAVKQILLCRVLEYAVILVMFLFRVSGQGSGLYKRTTMGNRERVY